MTSTPCEVYAGGEMVCACCSMPGCLRRWPAPPGLDVDLDQGVADPVAPANKLAATPRGRIALALTSIQAPADVRALIMEALDLVLVAARSASFEDGRRIGHREGFEECSAQVYDLWQKYRQPTPGLDPVAASDRRHQANAHFRQPGP